MFSKVGRQRALGKNHFFSQFLILFWLLRPHFSRALAGKGLKLKLGYREIFHELKAGPKKGPKGFMAKSVKM